MPDESFKTIQVNEETTVREVYGMVISKLVNQETFETENLSKYAVFEESLEGKTVFTLLDDKESILTIKNKWETSKKQYRFVFRNTDDHSHSESHEKVSLVNIEVYWIETVWIQAQKER